MFIKKSFRLLLLFAAVTLNAQDNSFNIISLTASSGSIAQNQLSHNFHSYKNLALLSKFTTIPHKLISNKSEKNLKRFAIPNSPFLTKDALSTNLLTQDIVTIKRLNESLKMTLLAAKKSRSGMEKTGRILTYIGVPLGIIGGIMVAGADELYYECTNGNCSGDARGGFGVVLLGAGVGLSGTGTVLWVLGSKK